MITSLLVIALLQMNPIILQPIELRQIELTPIPQLVLPAQGAPAVMPSGRPVRPRGSVHLINIQGQEPITTQQIGRDITVTSQGAKMTTCVRTGMVTSCF